MENQLDYAKIGEIVASKIVYCSKEILTSDEVCAYMGISKSALYKMTMRRQIPHFKPNKMCYFDRKEIEQWIRDSRVSTDAELTAQADAYCRRRGGIA